MVCSPACSEVHPWLFICSGGRTDLVGGGFGGDGSLRRWCEVVRMVVSVVGGFLVFAVCFGCFVPGCGPPFAQCVFKIGSF